MKPTLREIEDCIRFGKGADARDELIRITRRRVPREHAATIAHLAWRAGAPEVGARVLHPILRPARGTPKGATPEEWAEYAQCLNRLGAGGEAEVILAGLEPTRTPRAWRYLAAIHMARWDYAAALPLLTKFIAAKGVGNYERLVGQVNLAAAYIDERSYTNARNLLRQLRYETSVRGLKLLEGNALELSAQNCLRHRKWDLAARFLQEAEARLSETKSRDAFFVRKWKAILSLLSKGEAKGLTAIRGEAETTRDWETIRDCDRFEAVVSRRPSLVEHLWFGTPFEAFRKELLAEVMEKMQMPRTYIWRLGDATTPVVDIETGTIEGRKAGTALKAGQTMHRLLRALTEDFYRPQRIASLYGRVFPGEFFNPLTSPPRVRQTIQRLRNWFADEKVPARIVDQDGFYRLEGKAAFRVSSGKVSLSAQDLHLRKLQTKWPDQPFSVDEAARFLGLPYRSAFRVVADGLAEGKLAKQGARAGARYYFLSTEALLAG